MMIENNSQCVNICDDDVVLLPIALFIDCVDTIFNNPAN
jgi:hypothetical protein